MIKGVVTADREAVIRVAVHGSAAKRVIVEAVIDTGFDGWLSLPPNVIRSLGLPWRRRGLALLADGSESVFDIFEGSVVWDRRRLRIPIDETNSTPLIGMALLDGFKLVTEVRIGGPLSLRRLR
jgi:clan AA aspartic protease